MVAWYLFFFFFFICTTRPQSGGGGENPPLRLRRSLVSRHRGDLSKGRRGQARAVCLRYPTSMNKQRPADGCVRGRQGDYTHTHTHTHTHTWALTQPRADSTGIIRNIWDHLQREHELWWDPDALWVSPKYRNPYLREAITGSSPREASVCVCVCVFRPDTKLLFVGGSSIFRSDSV